MRLPLCDGDDTVLSACNQCDRYCLLHGKTPEDRDEGWLREPLIVKNICRNMVPRVEERHG